MLRYLIIAVGLLVSACSQEAVSEKLERAVPAEDKTLARSFVENLAEGDKAALAKQVEPQLLAQTADAAATAAKVLPDVAPTTMRLLAMNWQESGGLRQTTLIYELNYGDAWYLTQLHITRQGKAAAITGWYVQPMETSAAEATRFELGGKSAFHYLVLALAVLSPLTIITSLVMLARSKGVKRRWLWAIGCLIGIGRFTINWQTGQFAYQPIYFMLLGAGAFKSPPYAPWQISFALPVFAILFLLLRKRLLARAAPPMETA